MFKTRDNTIVARPSLAFILGFVFAFIFALIFISGCAERKLTGKRAELPGFESAVRAKSASASGKTIKLSSPRATSSWQQELFSSLHNPPHLNITPEWKRRFTLNTGASRTIKQPLQASPVVGGGYLFSLSGKGVVSAFDVETGKREWQRNLQIKKEKGFGGGLALSGQKLIVTTGSGNIFALSSDDGEILWNHNFPFPLRSAPTVSEKHILAITPNHRVLALSLDGEALWQHQSPNQTATQLTLAPSAAIVGRYAIVGYGDGSLFALDLANGQALWKVNITTRRNDSLSDLLDISAPPVVSGGVVYASSYSGKTAALDLASGSILWRISLATTSWLTLSDNYLFVVDNNSIVSALDIRDGRVIWERQLITTSKGKKKKAVFWNGPLLTAGRLIVSGSNGEIITLSALDGVIVSRQKFGSKFTGSPIAAGNKLFLLDSKGRVQIFE